MTSRQRGALAIGFFVFWLAVLVAVVFALLPHAPEPGLPPPALLDRLIWVGVLAFVGALSAGALWGVARLWMSRR